MFRMGVNKVSRRATNLKSGQRCKGDVFLGAQKIGNRVQERCNYGNEFLIGRMEQDQSGGIDVSRGNGGAHAPGVDGRRY